jgi:NADH:ubiquinone oxidoreductase subunit 5 (subunit L)/multisubunit Na+/H+ antiporter MnhA subunit
MALVVLADDAYAFMVMWETMALSSFFLVTANHRIAEIRGRLPLPADRARRRHRHPAVFWRAAGGHR